MKQIITYFLFLIIIALTLTCKKKPDAVKILVYDPLLDQPIANAEVSLVEFSYSGGIFNGSGKCDVIKTARTNSDGEAVIEGLKLRSKDKYDYFAAVSNCYDRDVHFSCANQKDKNFLPKTNGQISKKIYFYLFESYSWIQLEGIENFGQSLTDSFSVMLYKNFPLHTDFDSEFNNYKSYRTGIAINKTSFASFPTGLKTIDAKYKTPSGNYKVIMYKRKNGIVSDDTVLLQILPNETKSIRYQW